MTITSKPQGNWHAASDKASDPVGCYSGTDWGFWDETWSSWHGGYASEGDARAGLREYAKTL